MKWIPNQWTIIRGQDEQLCVALVDSDGIPVNISGATQVNMRLYQADKTLLVKPAYNGISWGVMTTLYMYGFQFSGAETLLLAKAAAQTIEIEIQYGAQFKVLEFPKSLTVIDRIVA
jgi:hypothetical protein